MWDSLVSVTVESALQKEPKGVKSYSGSGFQRVQLMVAWPWVSEQNVMVTGK